MIDRRTLLAGLAAGAATAPPRRAARRPGRRNIPNWCYAVDPGRERLRRGRPLRPVHRLSDQRTRHQGDAAGRQRLRRGDRGPARRQHAYRLLRPGLVRPRPADRGEDRRLRHRRQQRRHARATTRCSTCWRTARTKTLEDLKGKNLGLVDPNSTSGYNMPLYRAEQARHSGGREVFLQGGDHRQPRERGAGAGPGHGGGRRQLVERRRRQQPDPHAQQGHGQGRRRQAADEGGFPHHPEVRPDHQLADRLSHRPAGRSEGGDPPGLPGRAEEGPGGVRPSSPTARTGPGSRSTTPPTTTRSS